MKLFQAKGNLSLAGRFGYFLVVSKSLMFEWFLAGFQGLQIIQV